MTDFVTIPVSALKGDNVFDTFGDLMPWYQGPPALLEHLETVDVTRPTPEDAPFHFPGPVDQPPHTSIFSGYSGTVSSGSVRNTGDESHRDPSVREIEPGRTHRHLRRRSRQKPHAGQAVTLVNLPMKSTSAAAT